MKIKSFLFARNFERKPDESYDAHQISASTPFLDGPPERYPARVTRQGLIRLERASTFGNAPISLRFRLFDATNRLTDSPWPALFEAEFTDGECSCYVLANLTFEFSAPGLYRLDINLYGGGAEDVFHFLIDTAFDERSTLPVVYQGRSPAQSSDSGLNPDHNGRRY
jgi:hypothetical protein